VPCRIHEGLAKRLLSEGGYDLVVLNRRLKCGLEEDRDLIAALNLGMRGAQATQMPMKT